MGECSLMMLEFKVARAALMELDLLYTLSLSVPWKKREVCSENKLLLSAKITV